jgi:hypothetical protein
MRNWLKLVICCTILLALITAVGAQNAKRKARAQRQQDQQQAQKKPRPQQPATAPSDRVYGVQLTDDSGYHTAPAAARIEAPVERLYQAGWVEPEAEETESPEDDRVEALPEVLDLAALMAEALALALPLYPRAEGAELGTVIHTEPGAAPLTDEAARPFAGLKGLIDKAGGTD